MTLLRSAVLAAIWVAQVTHATSLGYEQRQAFALWQKQHRHGALSSRQTTSTSCVSATPTQGLTERMNALLQNGGENYKLSLCPSTIYPLTAPLVFTNKNQEISTFGYPVDESRATLLVNGSTADGGSGHTVAVQGGCDSCEGIKIRNIQIDGNRRGAHTITGGGNIEIGGSGGAQLVEYVKSFDPRGWSCLHIAEGVLNCSNATVRYNDIGPCGSDEFGQWADGISLSCKDSQVYDNWIADATDGGIVIFESPGSLIQNNTVWVENSTCLGGINLVDYDPFSGNYTGTRVINNTVVGGYANTVPTTNPQYANNTEGAMIKMGIPVGLKPWFGEKWGTATAFGGSVIGNKLSGAFGFGMPVSGVKDFMIANNTLFGNTSFIGTKGPTCTTNDVVPPAVDFVVDPNNVASSAISGNFKLHSITGLLCFTPPPRGGQVWPLGTPPDPSPPQNGTVANGTPPPSQANSLSPTDWCLSGESTLDCVRRFAAAMGIKLVAERRL
ncbi:hypothetical protein FRC08_014320 [Ceratobasidium sp. 394]|nr:hypothetical protein FRC08_014320 [Ceratobasidium sp. 394]KAG9091807.1 hypothetical protein FS749_016233 [Ceratobasidium sp. UAMH 11750]